MRRGSNEGSGPSEYIRGAARATRCISGGAYRMDEPYRALGQRREWRGHNDDADRRHSIAAFTGSESAGHTHRDVEPAGEGYKAREDTSTTGNVQDIRCC